MRSHRRIRGMACLLLVALLLSGCQIGNTKVVFLKPVGYHQVFKIDKEVCKKKEAKVYLTNYMNIYGNAYGVSLRKQKSVQEDLEQYVKDLTISQLFEDQMYEWYCKRAEDRADKGRRADCRGCGKRVL